MEKNVHRKKKNSIRNNWQLYSLLILPMVFLVVFNYYPMYGAIIAFKDYTIGSDILSCPWAEPYGMGNFLRFFSNYNFVECLLNTLTLSVYSLVVNFPCSIILALCLNYFHHCIGWDDKFIVQRQNGRSRFIDRAVYREQCTCQRGRFSVSLCLVGRMADGGV